jgi:hypothetical protein
MFRHLGPGANQAHIPPKHIQQLGQLIELPPAQKTAHQSKLLVARRGDGMTRPAGQVGHGPEFQNGESLAVTTHALLQEKHGAIRCQPHRQSDYQQDRNQQGKYQQNTDYIEEALGTRPRPGTQLRYARIP